MAKVSDGYRTSSIDELWSGAAYNHHNDLHLNFNSQHNHHRRSMNEIGSIRSVDFSDSFILHVYCGRNNSGWCMCGFGEDGCLLNVVIFWEVHFSRSKARFAEKSILPELSLTLLVSPIYH